MNEEEEEEEEATEPPPSSSAKGETFLIFPRFCGTENRAAIPRETRHDIN